MKVLIRFSVGTSPGKRYGYAPRTVSIQELQQRYLEIVRKEYEGGSAYLVNGAWTDNGKVIEEISVIVETLVNEPKDSIGPHSRMVAKRLAAIGKQDNVFVSVLEADYTLV